jgi:hypothetical protein
MADVTPFLSKADFVLMFRELSAQEDVLAGRLLKGAAIRIRTEFETAGRTAPALDDEMAILVSFQMVRDALPAVQGWAGHTSYEWETDDKREAGTLADPAAGFLDLTDAHREMLGLSSSASPQYGGFDSGFDVYGDNRVLPGSVMGYAGW